MKHYGDITKINGAKVEPVDVITGGSPCQDLSVAGKRAGLAGERSGLFMEQIRIIKEMRKHELELHCGRTDEPLRPRYMVWENVYGAFSSNGGEDFRAVLEETAKVAQGDAVIPQLADGQKWPSSGYIMGDRWSIAWRGHDAQWWGVPQRRKRVCLVADFDGHSAPYILFDPRYGGETEYTAAFETVGDIGNQPRPEVQSVREGMLGNPSQSGRKREGTPTAAEDGSGKAISFQERAGKPGGGKGILIQDEHVGALNCQCGQSVCAGVVSKGNGDAFLSEERHTSLSIGGGQAGQGYPCVMESRCLNPWDVQSKHIQSQDGIAEALYSGECRGGGGESYVMQEPISFTTEMTPKTDENGVGFSLRSRDYKDPQGVCQTATDESQCIPINTMVATRTTEEKRTTFGVGENGDPQFTLSSAHEHAVCCNPQTTVYGVSSYDSHAMKNANPHSGIYEAETSRTLDLHGGSPACNQGGMIVLEGNGARGSHHGDGYAESEKMYTLNTVEQHAVCAPTYQDVTGTLSPGAHAGSYNGQDAYNDMLVVQGGSDDGYGETVGSLCARDWKGIGTQYVNEGKCVLQKTGAPAECGSTAGVGADANE